MTISGFSPITGLSALGANAALPANQLAAQGNLLPNGGVLAAQAGTVEKPGIGSRLVSAVKAAIGELRGSSPVSALPTSQLAMQAVQPVSVAKPAATTAKPRTAKKVVHAKTWKTLANPPKAAAAAPVATQPSSTLPVNATQVPGATVYSYDQYGNPVAPTMAQLGVNPQMIQGLAGQVDPDGPQGPQVNATNQTAVGGTGSGLGYGSAVPVLGAPILTTPTTSSGDTNAGSGTGGSQTVTNRNDTDVSSRNQGLGFGYGGYGDVTGGIATPFSPYGASMTGAYLGSQNKGFFSRLLGL